MCYFLPQISKTFFPINKIFTKTFISLFVFKKNQLYNKKEWGTLSQYFLNLSS